jgi:monofunctional glycosyltransferase
MARRRGSSGRGLFGIVWRTAVYAVFALVVLFSALLALWSVAHPVSMLMIGRLITGQGYQRDYVRLADVSPVLIQTVVTSEDGQFCRNHGVDWGELREVLDNPDGPSRGASTITMQVAKNLFLWPGRSALRKAIEIPIALVLGTVWSKKQTLEAYLNIAEWGDGLFGVEAAARRYFHKSARQLDAREAALLATSLPNPQKRDPSAPSGIQRRLAARLASRARAWNARIGCVQR